MSTEQLPEREQRAGQLQRLLEGYDIWKMRAHRVLHFTQIGRAARALTWYTRTVAVLETTLQQAEQKNSELTTCLEIRERINGALVNQPESENRRLQEERERLQKELQELEERDRRYTELNTLLKEDLA